MKAGAGTYLIKAGYLPFLTWLPIATIAGFFAADYSPIASHVSVMTLEDGTAHLLANIAAISTGIALILFGFGVWKFSRRLFAAGALCWIVFGISMIANGIWPMGGPMHGLYIIGIFNILAPALTLLDIENETLRKKLHGLTVFVSLASMFYLWMLLNGFDPDGYTGMTQRIFASVGYFWPCAFAYSFFKDKTI